LDKRTPKAGNRYGQASRIQPRNPSAQAAARRVDPGNVKATPTRSVKATFSAARSGGIGRQAPVASEDQEHKAVAAFLRLLVGEPGQISEHGVVWFTLEHGQFRLSHKAARDRKLKGVISGLPDICIRWNKRTFWIELKRLKDSRVGDEQKAVHATLRSLGDDVAVCKGWEAALSQVSAWAIPIRSDSVLGREFNCLNQ
jgi:DNA-binding PucR family transcriptional regulator